MSERQKLQTTFSEWERGDRQATTDTDMTDGPSSAELQVRIEELDSTNQQQAKALSSAEVEKSEGLEMVLAKTRDLRKVVEKITESFATRLGLELGYDGADCETIHSEDENSSAGYLAMAGKYRDEIEALERSIYAFIALCGLETNTPRMDEMLSMVERRVGIIEQEVRNMQEFHTEIEDAREKTAVQRKRLDAHNEELREAKSLVSTLREGYETDISSLDGALKVAQDKTEVLRKEAEGASNLGAELGTAKAENEVLQNREAELNRQVRKSAEAWKTEKSRIHGLEQGLAEARLLLEAASHVQKALDQERSGSERLRQLSESSIDEVKATRDRYKKQLNASTRRVTELEKGLKTAQQPARIRQEEIAVAQAKADASRAEDLGDLMQREAGIRADILQDEVGIVRTGNEILICSGRKVRFESIRTNYRRGVDHIDMKDLEDMLATLHGQVNTYGWTCLALENGWGILANCTGGMPLEIWYVRVHAVAAGHTKYSRSNGVEAEGMFGGQRVAPKRVIVVTYSILKIGEATPNNSSSHFRAVLTQSFLLDLVRTTLGEHLVIMEAIQPTMSYASAAKVKGGGTIQSNGLATPEGTPGPDPERNAADQVRQSIEISNSLGPDPERNAADQVRRRETSNTSALDSEQIAADKPLKSIETTNTPGPNPERNAADQVRQSREISNSLGPDPERNAADQVRQIIETSNTSGREAERNAPNQPVQSDGQLEKIQQSYMDKVPKMLHDKKGLQELQAAVLAAGVPNGWLENANIRLGLMDVEMNDAGNAGNAEDAENAAATAFINKVHEGITPAMGKILSGDEDDNLITEVLEANKTIESWQQKHPAQAHEFETIHIEAIVDIVRAYFQVAKDPTNIRIRVNDQYLLSKENLEHMVESYEYPKAWVLKPLPEGAPLGAAPVGAAPVGAAPVPVDPWALNKLNAGKPGYTPKGEQMVGHKFNYFQWGAKRGEISHGQIIVATGPQAHPQLKLLARRDFDKNTINAYLTCDHAQAVGGRTDKDEFVEVIHVVAGPRGAEPLKEPTIYSYCSRKEGDPLWTTRTDLQKWVESKRAADSMIHACMEEQEKERATFYAEHRIEVVLEEHERREDKRARLYGRASQSLNDVRTFPFVEKSVSRASKAQAQPVNAAEQPARVEARFDPTNFTSFAAWYEERNGKIGADKAKLAKLTAAFETISGMGL
ncbi:hypothetical protein V490_00493 [Pseudogymnoascus sp. VKM F-3557]|nr:hypothetical protein V490_00493 [Pseudogymnoascus sp. VKM F-3557]